MRKHADAIHAGTVSRSEEEVVGSFCLAGDNKTILDYGNKSSDIKDPRLGRLAAVIVGCGFVLWLVCLPSFDSMSSRARGIVGVTTFVLCVAGTVASTIAILKPVTRTTVAKIACAICLLWWSMYGFLLLVN